MAAADDATRWCGSAVASVAGGIGMQRAAAAGADAGWATAQQRRAGDPRADAAAHDGTHIAKPVSNTALTLLRKLPWFRAPAATTHQHLPGPAELQQILCAVEQQELQSGRQPGASPPKIGDAYMSPAGVVLSGLPMPDLSTSAAFPAPISGPTGTLLQVHIVNGL